MFHSIVTWCNNAKLVTIFQIVALILEIVMHPTNTKCKAPLYRLLNIKQQGEASFLGGRQSMGGMLVTGGKKQAGTGFFLAGAYFCRHSRIYPNIVLLSYWKLNQAKWNTCEFEVRFYLFSKGKRLLFSRQDPVDFGFGVWLVTESEVLAQYVVHLRYGVPVIAMRSNCQIISQLISLLLSPDWTAVQRVL